MAEQQPLFAADTSGKYRWNYELNMFTNHTVMLTVCKVFGGIILGLGLFIGLLIQEDALETVKFILIFWGSGCGIFLVVGALAYGLLALIYGGKYCIDFEMDDTAVTHTQRPKPFQRAQFLASLVSLLGVFKKSPSLMGTGILVGSRNSMKTSFKKVNKIKANRNRQVIYLHTGFSWNQVYAQPERFDTVLTHILARIPSTARRMGDV